MSGWLAFQRRAHSVQRGFSIRPIRAARLGHVGTAAAAFAAYLC